MATKGGVFSVLNLTRSSGNPHLICVKDGGFRAIKTHLHLQLHLHTHLYLYLQLKPHLHMHLHQQLNLHLIIPFSSTCTHALHLEGNLHVHAHLHLHLHTPPNSHQHPKPAPETTPPPVDPPLPHTKIILICFSHFMSWSRVCIQHVPHLRCGVFPPLLHRPSSSLTCGAFLGDV